MRETILTELFTSKEFNACIKKMEPVTLQEDLKAEVGLILCEMDEVKLRGLYERKELKFYTVRIICNLIQSNTSPFYKKFRKFSAITDSADMFEDIGGVTDEPASHIESAAIDAIDSLYWYDREIVKLYVKHGNYRAVEKETGIPFESIYKTVQRAAKEIRSKVA